MRRISFPLFRLALALALVSTATAARAQDPDAGLGTVRGHALSGTDGSAISYALVSLRPVDGRPALGSTLTRQDGSFQFAWVPPGEYRLRLERIGFGEEWSDTLRVAAGFTVEWTFRGAARPIAVAGVASALTECYTEDRLARDAELSSLWNEARKGVETKRVFDREHRYRYRIAQLTYAERAVRRDSVARMVDSLTRVFVNDPVRHQADARRRTGWGSRRGNTMDLEIPDGTEILDPAFLRTHCLESGFEAVDDGWELDFRPVRTRREIDIRGTVTIERGTFQLRSMRLEYVQRGRPLMEATLHFQDHPVPGGTLRFPSVAFFAVHRNVRGRDLSLLEGRAIFTNYGPFERMAQGSAEAPDSVEARERD